MNFVLPIFIGTAGFISNTVITYDRYVHHGCEGSDKLGENDVTSYYQDYNAPGKGTYRIWFNGGSSMVGMKIRQFSTCVTNMIKPFL